jgi:hypothetical protein
MDQVQTKVKSLAANPPHTKRSRGFRKKKKRGHEIISLFVESTLQLWSDVGDTS